MAFYSIKGSHISEMTVLDYFCYIIDKKKKESIYLGCKQSSYGCKAKMTITNDQITNLNFTSNLFSNVYVAWLLQGTNDMFLVSSITYRFINTFKNIK